MAFRYGSDGALPLSCQALHTQMKEHARCLSLPQLAQSIQNLGGGSLPAIEMIVRSLLLDIYAERSGIDAARRLMQQVGIEGVEQPAVMWA